jgi:hypothetical protein
MLEGALRSSNAQFEPAFVLDRIGVRLLEASAGDSGWETFSLDYALDGQPAVFVNADGVIYSLSLDYALNGQPFVAQPDTEITPLSGEYGFEIQRS